jgi:pilus assembly protein FimV
VVRQGDTLRKIATDHPVEGATSDQVMVAIYQANPDAFINGNMNLLRLDKEIQLPGPTTVRAIDDRAARQLRIAQDETWASWRRSGAGAPTGSVPAAPAGGDRVRLGTDGGPATRVAAGGDDAVARDRELRDLQAKLEVAERNIREMQALLRQRADQAMLVGKTAESAGSAAPGAGSPVSVTAPAAPAGVAPGAATPPEAQAASGTPGAGAAAAPATDSGAGPIADSSPTRAPATPPDASAAAGIAPVPAPVPAPPPEEPAGGLIDFLLDNILSIGTALVVLFGSLAGLTFWRRRARRASLPAAAGGGVHDVSETSSVFGAVGGQSVDTGSAAISQPEEPSQIGIGVIDTEEVDPLAEADVYMAYGRDTQAEEILREALHKAPSRNEVRGKLLEIYAARKDARAFAAAAADLFVATQGVGADWQRAAALGAQLDPANPMYRAGAEVPKVDAQALGGITPGIVAAADESSVRGEVTRGLEAAATSDFTFDLDLGQAPDAHSTVMDLDLSPIPARVAQAAASTGSIDFVREESPPRRPQIADPQPGAMVDTRHSPPPAPVASAFDLGDIDLNLGPLSVSTPTELDARWQETATKLDLARVYHDMGHHDDARELLAEVLREGDTAQQAQARKLLDNLG